jgi:hypothetical protein
MTTWAAAAGKEALQRACATRAPESSAFVRRRLKRASPSCRKSLRSCRVLRLVRQARGAWQPVPSVGRLCHPWGSFPPVAICRRVIVAAARATARHRPLRFSAAGCPFNPRRATPNFSLSSFSRPPGGSHAFRGTPRKALARLSLTGKDDRVTFRYCWK